MKLRKRVLAGAGALLMAGLLFGGCGPSFGGGGKHCPVVQYQCGNGKQMFN